jgi:energy-coupling factor transport system substrate-specific component
VSTALGTTRRRTTRAVPLHPRSVAALAITSTIGLFAFAWPLLVDPRSELVSRRDGPWLFAVVLGLLVVVLLAEVAEGGMDAKAVALLGVLTAVATALRPLSGGVTGFQPLFVVLVLAGRVFGPGFGFVLGGTSLFASAMLTGGVGPWLPFQMLAAAWVGLVAGLLPPAHGWPEVGLLAGYGAAAGLAFGFVMNLWFWPTLAATGSAISYVAGAPLLVNLHHLLAFTVATSLGFDVPRAAGTAVVILIVGRPSLAALRRTAVRAQFTPAVVWTPPA